MKILITGGTGFLGRKTVALLHQKGHSLRLLVRPTSDRSRLPEGVEFADGDVTDLESLRRAVEGCEAVIHAAALVKIMAPDGDFDRINVGGTAKVIKAVVEAGVAKLVYVSSFMALGPTENGPGGMLDESAPPDDRPWINSYERTKTLSDRHARMAIAEGVPMNVVYPGVIYGPGELTEGNIVVRHLLDLVGRKLPGLVGKPARRWNYSFVDDVAQGVVLVLEQAAAGERYVLGGENISQGDFYALVHRLTGVKPPGLRFPDSVATLSGALMKTWARVFGGTPKLTPDLIEIYRHDWALSSYKAQNDLGYDPRTLEQGLGETIAWLKETGAWSG